MVIIKSFVAHATVASWIEEGLIVVDTNQELVDNAVRDLIGELHKGDVKLSPKEAFTQATSTVRADPAAWQKGRDRARRLLEFVRNKLPHKERGRLRNSIADLLAEAERARLSNPIVAVPSEVRAVLDSLAS